jgi:hypothetical protein
MLIHFLYTQIQFIIRWLTWQICNHFNFIFLTKMKKLKYWHWIFDDTKYWLFVHKIIKFVKCLFMYS